jgi:hypothetical protein
MDPTASHGVVAVLGSRKATVRTGRHGGVGRGRDRRIVTARPALAAPSIPQVRQVVLRGRVRARGSGISQGRGPGMGLTASRGETVGPDHADRGRADLGRRMVTAQAGNSGAGRRSTCRMAMIRPASPGRLR